MMVQKSLTIINLLLIAAAVFLCVETFYTIVEYRLDVVTMETAGSGNVFDRQAEPGPRRSTGTAGNPESGDYAVVYEKDLFNTAQKADADQEIEPSELDRMEKTELNLRLWGTITGTNGKSYAVIEHKSKREQKLYQKGDTIDQARIKMILRKKVVLSVNGKDEILELEELVDQSGRVSDRASSDDRDTGISRRSQGGPVNIDREQISAAMQDVNNLMRQVRVRPYFDEDGSPAGIMLSGIRSNSIFEDMGLESGDIIKAINGRQIRSVEDAMQFYQNLKSASEVELQIQRSGSQQTIQYRID
ncbi:MAG: PDZ domain-containing protein [Desulfobacteraceae bacterium]|nr:PDZ domain-containing protein [Desulfobacteraceae bacterium]